MCVDMTKEVSCETKMVLLNSKAHAHTMELSWTTFQLDDFHSLMLWYAPKTATPLHASWMSDPFQKGARRFPKNRPNKLQVAQLFNTSPNKVSRVKYQFDVWPNKND